MKVVAEFSQKDGKRVISYKFKKELKEIYEVIGAVNLNKYRTKKSKEKTMMGRMLYSPRQLNTAYDKQFAKRKWRHRVRIKLPFGRGAFREMDFVKNALGVEVQFGKYAFMAYNVSAKMTIFHNHKIITAGVEIVPTKKMADEMSTGVSYFEQIKWDLENRGVADIDIPVLILGIA